MPGGHAPECAEGSRPWPSLGRTTTRGHILRVAHWPPMNITLSVDEQTVEKARRMAQAMHKSLNQLVR